MKSTAKQMELEKYHECSNPDPKKLLYAFSCMCLLPLRFWYVSYDLNNYIDQVPSKGIKGRGWSLPSTEKASIVWRDKEEART